MQQAQAASDAAAYRAQVAANNAAIAKQNQQIMENNARTTEAAGAAKGDQEAMKARELLGRQKAAAAASGLDVNSGSALDIRAGTAGMAMLTDLNVRDDTNRRAAALRQQGANYAAQGENFLIDAEAARTAGSAAETGGILSATGGLLGGAAKTGSLISEYQRTGVPMYDLTIP
jgi:hypothetical protein